MDWDRVIYNGTVVNDDGMQRADIYIRDGRVAAVTSERLPGTVGETTDASGRYILPGLIETHVHSRDGSLAGPCGWYPGLGLLRSRAPHLRGKAPFLLGCPRRNQRYRGAFSCAAHRCPPRPADVGRILRTFKIKKNVEVTDNGKDNF